jgi:DNA-binding NarL/FixJ family response regulator
LALTSIRYSCYATKRQPFYFFVEKLGLAARQIRKLAPETKIIFVTQESSADIVQACLNTGAGGYVVKTTAANDLLAAINPVMANVQFVSSGLEPSGSD